MKNAEARIARMGTDLFTEGKEGNEGKPLKRLRGVAAGGHLAEARC